MAEETQYNGGGNPVQWKGEGILSVGKGEGGGMVVKGLLCCLEVVWSPLIGVIG